MRVTEQGGPGEAADRPAPVAEVPTERRVRHLRTTLRAVVLYGVTLFAIVTVIFAIPRAMPGDPIQGGPHRFALRERRHRPQVADPSKEKTA